MTTCPKALGQRPETCLKLQEDGPITSFSAMRRERLVDANFDGNDRSFDLLIDSTGKSGQGHRSSSLSPAGADFEITGCYLSGFARGLGKAIAHSSLSPLPL